MPSPTNPTSPTSNNQAKLVQMNVAVKAKANAVNIKPTTGTSSSSLSNLSQIKANIKALVETISDTYESVEAAADVAIDMIDDVSLTYTTVVDGLINTIDSPFNTSNDLTGSYSDSPSSKNNPNKTCGNLTLAFLRSTAESVKQVATNGRDIMNTLSNMEMSFSWKHAAAVGIDTLNMAATQYAELIDSIVTDCRSLTNICASIQRPVYSEKNATFIKELVNILTTSLNYMQESYYQYLNHSWFDSEKWDDADDQLEDAIEYIDSRYDLGAASARSLVIAGEAIGDLKRVFDNMRMIQYRLCLLTKNVTSAATISNNVTELNNTKLPSATTVSASSVLDKVACHVKYIIDSLTELSGRGTPATDMTMIDMYTSLRQLHALMGTLGAYIKELVDSERTPLSMTLMDMELVDTAVEDGLSFTTIVNDFLQEISSTLYSSNSMDRVNVYMRRVEEAAVILKKSVAVFQTGELDEETANLLNDALVFYTSVKSSIPVSKLGQYADMLSNGDYYSLVEGIAGDYLSERFSFYINAVSFLSAGKINTELLKRRADNVNGELNTQLVKQSVEDAKVEVSERKKDEFRQLKLYKTLTGNLARIREYIDKVSSAADKYTFRDKVITPLRESGDLSDISCNRKI